MIDVEAEKDAFLAHYGVPGMKWGKRRAARNQERQQNQDKAREKGYTAQQRSTDVALVGKSVARKVDKRVANGEAVDKARASESTKAVVKASVVAAAIYVAPKLIALGARKLDNALASAAISKGEKAAADLFASSKGVTSYKTISLAFDGARGVWG